VHLIRNKVGTLQELKFTDAGIKQIVYTELAIRRRENANQTPMMIIRGQRERKSVEEHSLFLSSNSVEKNTWNIILSQFFKREVIPLS
jgi:hypothetical protein